MRTALQALAVATIMILRAGPAVAAAPAEAKRSVASAAASPAERGARRLLDQLRSSTRTPAVSGAVARGGEVVFSAGSGLIDVQGRVPATGGSVYNIGSVSKAITAIAVMQLVEQGRAGLDDDVRKYVPSFPDKGATITLRHLLTHTAGIRHYRPGDFPGTPDNENVRPLTWEEGLGLFAQDPLLFPPGRYFFYTSYGVNLLQGVVQKASGVPFERYLRDRVFRPAGAATASFDDPGAGAPNRARSYRIVEGRPVDYYYNDLRYKLASGGMIASAEDLVRLGAALNHGLLMRPETRRLMLSPRRGLQEFREGSGPRKIGWMQGMLWRLRRDPRGRLVAYHCGSVKGFNACLVDFVEEDLVAAIATNSWECCGWKKADDLAALFRSAAGR